MPNLNNVEIIGSLGRDPKMTPTKSGATIATFTVAVDSNRKNQDGTWTKETEWFFVKAFSSMATQVGQRLQKGSTCYVQGQLKTEKWTDKNGQEQKLVVVNARNIQFLDPKQRQVQQQSLSQSDGGFQTDQTDACPF